MNVNTKELINDVLKLRNSGNFTDMQIANVVNATHGTEHSSESVRAIWRRHNDKKDITPSYELDKVSGWKYNVPIETEGNVLIIGDTHAPFTEKGYLDFLKDVYNGFNVNTVIHIGDLVDEYSLSFFDKDPDGDGASSELHKAVEFLQIMADVFPKMYVTVGNHDVRYLKLALKSGLPKAYLRSLEEVLHIPDEWVFNHSYVLNENILVEHGTGSGPTATIDRAWGTSMNVIQGHTHCYGGVSYRNCGFNTRWALNVGCGLDTTSYAAKYAIANKYKPTLGCGVIVNNVPMFIPYYG